jgi:hypothetical protein
MADWLVADKAKVIVPRLSQKTAPHYVGQASDRKLFTLPRLTACNSLKLYLLALNLADQILAKGVPCIAHGSQPVAYYRALIQCPPDVASQVVPGEKVCSLNFGFCWWDCYVLPSLKIVGFVCRSRVFVRPLIVGIKRFLNNWVYPMVPLVKFRFAGTDATMGLG